MNKLMEITENKFNLKTYTIIQNLRTNKIN